MQRLVDFFTILFYAAGVMFFVYMAYRLHLDHERMWLLMQALMQRH